MAIDPLLLQAINDVMGDAAGRAQAITTPMTAWVAGQAVKQQRVNAASMGTASTGTPIPELRGIARQKATISALDNGSKATGGGGIEGGLRSLRNSAIAVELAVFGISGAITVGRITVRYRQLVRQDRAIAAAVARARVTSESSEEPSADQDGKEFASS